MSVTIDKNIPAPFKKCKWPWLAMKPGNSFFAAGYGMPGNGELPQINHATGRRLVPGSQWTARTVRENGVAGVRVWRVK